MELRKYTALFLLIVLFIGVFAVPFNASAETNDTIYGVLGDADGTGSITVKDTTTIQKLSACKKVSIGKSGLMLADVDANGKINIKDSTTIQKWLVNKESNRYIGKGKYYSLGEIEIWIYKYACSIKSTDMVTYGVYTDKVCKNQYSTLTVSKKYADNVFFDMFAQNTGGKTFYVKQKGTTTEKTIHTVTISNELLQYLTSSIKK
ncbi:MAG: dockerin type I repeat-containing protein [Clostridia bacterium]|nr:dockerin type I repeat-containing protein [Clostridia bacterium]